MDPLSIVNAVELGLKSLYKVVNTGLQFYSNKKECERLYEHAVATLEYIKGAAGSTVSGKLARRLARVAKCVQIYTSDRSADWGPQHGD